MTLVIAFLSTVSVLLINEDLHVFSTALVAFSTVHTYSNIPASIDTKHNTNSFKAYQTIFQSVGCGTVPCETALVRAWTKPVTFTRIDHLELYQLSLFSSVCYISILIIGERRQPNKEKALIKALINLPSWVTELGILSSDKQIAISNWESTLITSCKRNFQHNA